MPQIKETKLNKNESVCPSILNVKKNKYMHTRKLTHKLN